MASRKPTPKTPEPSPGSAEAVAKGCTCPRIDNRHGEGQHTAQGRRWIITIGCPLHDIAPV